MYSSTNAVLLTLITYLRLYGGGLPEDTAAQLFTAAGNGVSEQAHSCWRPWTGTNPMDKTLSMTACVARSATTRSHAPVGSTLGTQRHIVTACFTRNARSQVD